MKGSPSKPVGFEHQAACFAYKSERFELGADSCYQRSGVPVLHRFLDVSGDSHLKFHTELPLLKRRHIPSLVLHS